MAIDQNKVFVTKAKEKLLGAKRARDLLAVGPGRGRSVIESDVPTARLETQTNPALGPS